MMQIKVPARLLKHGDIVLFNRRRLKVLGVENVLSGSAGCYWDETHVTCDGPIGDDGSPVIIAMTSSELDVLAASGEEVGQRIAAQLDEFDTAVRATIARTFCSTCGERECKRHR